MHRNVLYVGCTEDLKKRIYLHKKRLISGFTKKYNVDRLIYFEKFESLEEAQFREKQLKNYRREKKLQLIERQNPDWIDLYESSTS